MAQVVGCWPLTMEVQFLSKASPGVVFEVQLTNWNWVRCSSSTLFPPFRFN